MATVIDSLVVLLGLDASNYKKGRETAEKETSETARKAQIAADEITKSLVEVGKSVAALFLGFESVSGFSKFLGGLNLSEANLGRTATALGLNVHELNRYQLALQLAGQNGADAAAAFQTLNAGAIKFLSGQGTSPIIDLLRTAGVSAVDAAGKIRNQGEVFEDLARNTAKWGAQIQAQRFRDAGIAEGEVQFLIQAQAVRADQYRLAEKNNDVNDESIRKAQELQLYWRNVKQHIEAAGQLLLTAFTPTIEQILKIFGEVNTQSDEFATGLKLIGSAAIIIKNLFAGIGDTLGGAAAAVGAALHGDFRGALNILKDQSANSNARNDKEAADLNDLWEQKQATAANAVVQQSAGGGDGVTYRNHNPGNLQPYQAGQSVDSRGFRTFGSDAEGKAALEADLRAKMAHGLHTVDSLITEFEGHDYARNNIPAYIADVRKRLGKNELTAADIKQLAQAITTHEGAQVRTAAAGATHTTTVNIDAMHVSSPSANPRAVAEQVPAAIQRKLSVSQAAQGQS